MYQIVCCIIFGIFIILGISDIINYSIYNFFNEKNNNSIISGFTIVIYDYDYHVYATKFFKFKESEPVSFLTFKIEVFLKSKGAWEEGYEFNIK